MSIRPEPGHWYERRDGKVVKYTGPSTYDLASLYPHLVGIQSYTKDGFFFGPGMPDGKDITKDLGTTDPRLKKPRKKPAKKVRKVRMWFMQIGTEGKMCNNLSRDGLRTVRRILRADMDSHYVFGPIFSQIIEVPVNLPKKKKS